MGKKDSTSKKQRIINEIKEVKDSLQSHTEIIRSYSQRIKEITEKDKKNGRGNIQRNNQYVQCLIKYMHNDYNHDLMMELVNVVDNIEQSLNVTDQKSLKLKDCFTKEMIAYQNMTFIYNQKTCNQLKQSNKKNLNELSNWMHMRHVYINYFNYDLFTYRVLSELYKAVSS
uniref:DUF5063 domain-containing protein n=1 Tax=Schistosoma mansoni TaxID=6183 RepID=A0A5K4F7J4_SCHMA